MIPEEPHEVVGLVAARGEHRVWHWVNRLSPGEAAGRCGVLFEWRRSVRPDHSFLIELDDEDTLCPFCDDIEEWDGNVRRLKKRAR